MTRFLAYGCPHAPLTHRGWFEWLIGQIEDHKPQVIVNLGDQYESKWSKRWPKWSDETWSVLAEHNASADQFEAINKAAPKAVKVWLAGNHDCNGFNVHPDRISDDIVPALHWRENRRVSKALEKWVVKDEYRHRPESVYRLGQVAFAHGFETSAAGLRRSTRRYAPYHGLFIQAHTHRPDFFRLQADGQNEGFTYGNPGCGADWDRMHYMDRADVTKWGRGCIVGECNDNRSAFAQQQW